MLVAGGMGVTGELGPHVDRYAAALAVESAHGQIVSALEHILAHREVPTSANAGDPQVVGSGLVKAGEVRGLHLVAGVRVCLGRRELSAKDNGIVA